MSWVANYTPIQKTDEVWRKSPQLPRLIYDIKIENKLEVSAPPPMEVIVHK